MADKTIGEVYATTTHAAAEPDELVETEAADGSASFGRTVTELAASSAFSSGLSTHIADTDDAHDASAVSVADAGGFITGTEVESALTEGFNGKCAVNVVATSGATETLTMHPIQKVTMDQACTFTFPTPTTAGHIFMLHLLGAFTPTWPGTVDWADATPPTYATPSIFIFVSDDTGTTWFGAMVGSGFG